MIATPEKRLLEIPQTVNSEFTHLLKQQYPEKHDHYRFEDFFQFHHQAGIVTDWNEARNIFVTEDFIVGLIDGLEQEVGDAAGLVMYTMGYQWGLNDAKFFQQWFEKEYQKNVRETNTMFMLEAWWWPFISQGWGNWEIDMSEQKNGFMFINIFDSAVARSLGDVGKPVCHIYAGLFAGFFSEMVKKPLSCIEIQCYAMGETYCKFLLGRKDQVDAAVFWQNEGATARDIEKKMHNGEFIR
jgi:hypothetical protein